MRLLEAITLGLTQGLTEFLPVSSSAHLRIIPEMLGWDDPGASFTAALQLGTIAAVLVVFREDLLSVAAAWWRGLRRRDQRGGPGWTLGVHLIVGSIPISVLGVAVSSFVEGPLRNLVVIAAALAVGSAWLWASTRTPGTTQMAEATTRDALLIGVAQAAALVPGVSRSGATIGAAYRLGLEPAAAARYSFLLSVPAIVLAGIYGLRDLGLATFDLPTLIALAVAFATGWLSIRWLLQLVSAGRFGGFVVYRVVLAAVVLGLAIR